MRQLSFFYLCCFVLCAPLLVSAQAADPLSGTWEADWGPTPNHRNKRVLELKWDGKTLKGTLDPGPNAVKLVKTSFDPTTGRIHLEADAVGSMKETAGKKLHYIIEGTLEGGLISGLWSHEKAKGDFKLTRKKR